MIHEDIENKGLSTMELVIAKRLWGDSKQTACLVN